MDDVSEFCANVWPSWNRFAGQPETVAERVLDLDLVVELVGDLRSRVEVIVEPAARIVGQRIQRVDQRQRVRVDLRRRDLVHAGRHLRIQRIGGRDL